MFQGFQGLTVSMFQGFNASRLSRFQGFKVSRFQGFKVFKVSRFQYFKVFKVSRFRGLKVFKVSRFQGFSRLPSPASWRSQGFLDYLPAPPGQAKIFYTTSVGLPAKPKYFTLPPRASRRHRPLSKVVSGNFRPRAFFSVRLPARVRL